MRRGWGQRGCFAWSVRTAGEEEHFSAQQVACGEMAEIVGGAEPGGLGAFTGTRRANEEEALLH